MDGREVVSHTRRPPFKLGKIPGTHFSYRLSRTHSAAGTIRSIEKYNVLFGNLPTCDIVPQTTTSPRAPIIIIIKVASLSTNQYWVSEVRADRFP
jgi:hypothetical protein